jgi:DNA-binding NarL/FixJ family response regulator
MKKTQRLDTILKRRGWVTDEQIQKGLRQQQRAGRRWGSTLVELGIITETQLVEALSEQFGTPAWDPAGFTPDLAALRLFRESWLRKRGVIPLAFDPVERSLRVAMADPNNVVLSDEIRFHASAKSLQVLVAPEVTLNRLWDKFYGAPSETSQPQAVNPGKGGAPTPQKLGIDFEFSSGKIPTLDNLTPPEQRPTARVLLWLSQPFVAKLLKSLLEFERCLVAHWDGRSLPNEEWDYIVYDDDNALCHPDSLPRLKREMPRLQFVPRPSWASALLRTPLSYERMRDGYLQLAEHSARWLTPGTAQGGGDASRYALAMSRLLPLTPFEVDTLMAACELAPLIFGRVSTNPEREALAREIGCPYPVADLLRAAAAPFDQAGISPGQSTTESPFAARVFAVVTAFLNERQSHPINTIEEAGLFSELLRRDAGTRYDPIAVEALLRVVREEILEGYLPPGPSEVMLVADRPVEWSHLSLLLENEGWRVVIAGGASEARSLTERRKPDAVVWAAAGSLEWVRWQMQTAPGIANFLMLDEFDSALVRAALEAGFEDVWSGGWDAGVAAAKLRRAVERRPHAPSKSQAVTGTLSQLSFIDMVQILAAGTRSVKIELHKGKATAKIILWQGQIKYAEAAGKLGEEAVYEILAWQDATFSFSPVETMPQANCRMPNEAMLLEGCRLMDERTRNSDSGPISMTVSEFTDS